MVDFLKNNFIILIIILILGSYLGIKALNPNGWDGWGFGSAQTLMSSEYWAKDGFAKNYFLFIPQPYSKLIHYLDSPEFRNRPIDTFNGELARDRRLYYTHYPPLYLFPYALIAKLGIENRSVYRIFSLLISLAGLLFFYLFTKSISNKTVTIIASAYYGFSVTFLNYADSIAVQPWTILFAFLILYLSILAWHSFDNQKKYRKYNFYIWTTYLALSLSSYDATFFVLAYLILFDIFIAKKILWRKWLFFASTPVLGFAFQLIQNFWYLGWSDTWRDIYISYTGRAIGSTKDFFLGLITPFVSMTGIKTFYFFKKSIVALGSAVLIFGILWKLRQKINLNSDFFRFVFILGVAALVQPFFLNVTGWWPYQGVLTTPFWGLLLGAATLLLLQYSDVLKYSGKKAVLLAILALVVLGLLVFRFYDTFNYIKDWPNNKLSQQVIDFSKEIKKIYPGQEKLAFRIYPKNPEWKSQFPTFNMEYYIGMLKIDFANTKDLLTDFWRFRNVSEYPFYSFVIAENKNDIEKIRRELITKNLKDISSIMNIQGQYLFTVGPVPSN